MPVAVLRPLRTFEQLDKAIAIASPFFKLPLELEKWIWMVEIALNAPR